MEQVKKAIAAFERTIVSGDSPFDQLVFRRRSKTAMSDSAMRGFKVFLGDGRCVSCHVIEQDQALFTDNRFHNIGVGINRIQDEMCRSSRRSSSRRRPQGVDVDKAVLSDPEDLRARPLRGHGRLDEHRRFKTPTLRNVAVTAPYMHDGSLEDAAGRRRALQQRRRDQARATRVNDFLSGGIRPLNLTDQQIDDLVAFMEALTSPQLRASPQHRRGARTAGGRP